MYAFKEKPSILYFLLNNRNIHYVILQCVLEHGVPVSKHQSDSNI